MGDGQPAAVGRDRDPRHELGGDPVAVEFAVGPPGASPDCRKREAGGLRSSLMFYVTHDELGRPRARCARRAWRSIATRLHRCPVHETVELRTCRSKERMAVRSLLAENRRLKLSGRRIYDIPFHGSGAPRGKESLHEQQPPVGTKTHLAPDRPGWIEPTLLHAGPHIPHDD